jgi:hypothetical protein
MRLDERSRALCTVLTDLLATRDGAMFVFKKISGVLLRYDLDGDYERTGAAAPDLEFFDGTRVGEYVAGPPGRVCGTGRRRRR